MPRQILAALLIAATVGGALAAQQQPSAELTCRINGVARGAGVVLPGVAIVILEAGAVRTSTATQGDGTYRLNLPAGAYRLRTELTGFDQLERDLMVETGPACDQRVDLALSLSPRRPA